MEIASITGVATRLAVSIFVRKRRALPGIRKKAGVSLPGRVETKLPPR